MRFWKHLCMVLLLGACTDTSPSSVRAEPLRVAPLVRDSIDLREVRSLAGERIAQLSLDENTGSSVEWTTTASGIVRLRSAPWRFTFVDTLGKLTEQALDVALAPDSGVTLDPVCSDATGVGVVVEDHGAQSFW